MHNDFLDHMFWDLGEYDQSRLGGTAKVDAAPASDLEKVIMVPYAVFIFEGKVIVIAKDGEVTELDRA